MDTETESTWELKDSYRLDEFYMGVSSKRGEGQTAYVRMSPSVAGAISALVQSKTFPYRTNADFIRDAVVHRLQWCADMVGVTVPAMKAEIALSRAYQVTETMTMIQNAYREFERGIRLAKDNEDWFQVKVLVDNVRAVGIDMEEPWDSRFEKLATDTESSFPVGFSALLD